MSEQISQKCCPKCGTTNLIDDLLRLEYRCGDCGLELAHLDTSAQGAIRGVLGWLLDVGAMVNERYQITAVLGKGGFGVTYLVDDLRLHGKRRALKEIPELLFDEHETRLLGHLNHPAIPDIIDRFTDSGMVYLVLEFGGNRTLRGEQERRGGRIPVFVLLPWMRQLCEALQYLHSQDIPIVHRDLKPDNILLDDNDRIMLIDFGIAKEATPDTATRTLGRAVSHGFSPPEQVLGTGTDLRSDVYALSAVIYNVLTNAMPPAAHERITGKAVEPLAHFLPDIPPLIDAAVMKGLELNINLRQQSIAELAQVFDLVQSGRGSAATVCASGAIDVGAQPVDGARPVLPSVQIPSTRSHGADSSQPSVRIVQPESAKASPRQGRRPWAIALVGSLVLLSVSGASLWYLRDADLLRQFWGEAKSPPKESPTQAAELSVAKDQDNAKETSDAAVAPSGVSTVDVVQEVPPADAIQQHDAVQDTAAVAPQSDQPTTEAEVVMKLDPAVVPALERSEGTEVGLAAAVTAGAAATAAAGADPAISTDLLPSGSAAQDKSPAAASMQRSSQALPSIFSDEQPTVDEIARKPKPAGSLLELFEQQRGARLVEPLPKDSTPAPAPVPAAPVAPTEPRPAPKPIAKPKAKPKPKTVAKAKKRPRPAKQTAKRKQQAKPRSSSSPSAWGFKYKGATKQ